MTKVCRRCMQPALVGYVTATVHGPGWGPIQRRLRFCSVYCARFWFAMLEHLERVAAGEGG